MIIKSLGLVEILLGHLNSAHCPAKILFNMEGIMGGLKPPILLTFLI